MTAGTAPPGRRAAANPSTISPMRHLRAGLAVCLLALPALASAQPADEDETGGGTVHESDEVIGPDGTEPAPPDDAPPPDDAAPAAPIATGGNTGYDKGFFIKSDDGKFSLKIKARVQPYLALTRSKTPAADWTGAFEVRRARLILEGNLHGDDLRYKIQTDFGKGNPSLKDWYADARLSGSTWVRAGQWKRPFSRQQITSSGKLELGDRAITDKGFGAGRDIGIALHNGYEDSPAIEWIVGVWNGTGDAASFAVDLTDPDDPAVSVSNVPREFKPAFIGRVGLNSEGIKGYSEADLEGRAAALGRRGQLLGRGRLRPRRRRERQGRARLHRQGPGLLGLGRGLRDDPPGRHPRAVGSRAGLHRVPPADRLHDQADVAGHRPVRDDRRAGRRPARHQGAHRRRQLLRLGPRRQDPGRRDAAQGRRRQVHRRDPLPARRQHRLLNALGPTGGARRRARARAVEAT
ncbi:MAG: hypothetical protein IPH44_37370 [Myxococcales bacterium]|nr:hypothetical protein [Myxococcales bacterium]